MGYSMNREGYREVSISVGGEVTAPGGKKYPTNKIVTARYNNWNFLPIAFLVQFTKLGNVFWAVNLVLQLIPQISTKKPITLAILIWVIIGVGMVKEWLSDYKRSIADKQTNEAVHYKVKKVRSKEKGESCDGTNTVEVVGKDKQGEDTEYVYEMEEYFCEDIAVGDLLYLKPGDLIPADCIIVKVLSKENECQISTGQLDGEQTLKPKYSLKPVQANLETFLMKHDMGSS